MDREVGGAVEIPLSASAPAMEPTDPDHPHWGPLGGIGVWLFSYVCPILLLAVWLVLYQLFRPSSGLSSEGLQQWFATPTGILVTLAITLAGHLLTLGICWVLVTQVGQLSFLDTLGWDWGKLSPSGKIYLVSTVVIGIFILQFFLRFLLPESETTPFETMLKSSAQVRIFVAVMAVLTAPLVEEIVYRGVLYSGLRAKIGSVPSTIAVTLLFCVVHYQQYEGAWASLSGLLALSFVLTLVRAITRSVLPSFVIHLTYNLIGATLILLSL